VAVLLVHSVDTTYGLPANDALFGSWLRPFIRAILPMFFALSGFLVAGSCCAARASAPFCGCARCASTRR
jgi:peptidoglycan/LPS O-acetylase OafA/YrhL